MTITRTSTPTGITLSIAGRLDTITSAQLSQAVESVYAEGPANLVLDMTDLEYISSAGLGVIVVAQKRAMAQGSTVELWGATGIVKEVLEITGFSGILRKP